MGNPLPLQMERPDWEEIYYALETKAKLIEDGHYDPEDHPGDNKKWVNHLKRIMKKIESQVDV